MLAANIRKPHLFHQVAKPISAVTAEVADLLIPCSEAGWICRNRQHQVTSLGHCLDPPRQAIAIVLLMLEYLKSDDEIEGPQFVQKSVESPAENLPLVTDGGLRHCSRDRICLHPHVFTQ